MMMTYAQIFNARPCLIPCSPDNKTGLILIFTPKFSLGLIFGGCLFLMYQKMKLQRKNEDISK